MTTLVLINGKIPNTNDLVTAVYLTGDSFVFDEKNMKSLALRTASHIPITSLIRKDSHIKVKSFTHYELEDCDNYVVNLEGDVYHYSVSIITNVSFGHIYAVKGLIE